MTTIFAAVYESLVYHLYEPTKVFVYMTGNGMQDNALLLSYLIVDCAERPCVTPTLLFTPTSNSPLTKIYNFLLILNIVGNQLIYLENLCSIVNMVVLYYCRNVGLP